MIAHVLPGDSLVEDFQKTAIDGEIVVCRECLIVGPVDAETYYEFWDQRARFLLAEYGGDEIEYHEYVADELAKLIGSDLWNAYRSGDHAKLKLLGESNSPCFPYLKEVCEAEIEKDTRPVKILKEIGNGGKDFDEIFPEFVKRAGVYGFGDVQVRKIMQDIQ